MKRRALIGLGLGGVTGLSACRPAAERLTVPQVAGVKREGEDCAPVRVDESREIRTVAALRPYRPSGFVVRREDVEGKILVHNYGHGGGGMSLSWGSAHLAVQLAQPVQNQDCAVVGAGVMGLSVARLVFNCSGLGAGSLFDDRELTPIKGQLTFLLPQPDVNYNLISGDLYMFPRTDGILLGGTYESGQWNTEPDPAAKIRILSAHQKLFRHMTALQRGQAPI